MDRILTFLDSRKPATAAIIEGAFIGLEMREAFHRRGIRVAVIEKLPQIRPLLDRDMALHLETCVREDRFAVMTGAEARSFSAEGVELTNGAFVPAELIMLSVGDRAEVELARRTWPEIGVTGGVKVSARMESSDPDIYAVGDAGETTHMLTGARTRIPLAGPANRQGRIAGANAAGGHFLYAGAKGTSIVRVLHMTAEFTRLNSAQAAKAGSSFFTSVTADANQRWSSACGNAKTERNRGGLTLPFSE